MPQTIDLPSVPCSTPDDSGVPRIVYLHDAGRIRSSCGRALRNLVPFAKILDCSFAQAVFAYLESVPVDLIVMENWPHGDDEKLVRSIRNDFTQDTLPIIVAAQDADMEAAYRVFCAGANDYLMPSLDASECETRCRRALNHRQRYVRCKERLTQQENRIEYITEQLRQRERETLLTLARAANQRDNCTGRHLQRMAKYAFVIAAGSGLSVDKAREVELAAPMHDIGKIGIPDAILQHSGSLSAQQMRVMRSHTHIGYEILQGSSSSFIQVASMVALHHHEKFDGSGYPMGLQGEQIPIGARIVAIADVFDALTSSRPYKEAWDWKKAVGYIIDRKGSDFDPALVDVFAACDRELQHVRDVLMDQVPRTN